MHHRLAPALAACLVYLAIAHYSLLGAFAFDVAIPYLSLGFRQFSHTFTSIHAAIREGDTDRARELIGAWRGESATHRSREEVIRLAIEEAIAASHRHVFAVLFWFVLLPGPTGAILYRMAVFLDRRWGGKGEFGAFARRVRMLLDWPAVRLTPRPSRWSAISRTRSTAGARRPAGTTGGASAASALAEEKRKQLEELAADARELAATQRAERERQARIPTGPEPGPITPAEIAGGAAVTYSAAALQALGATGGGPKRKSPRWLRTKRNCIPKWLSSSNG